MRLVIVILTTAIIFVICGILFLPEYDRPVDFKFSKLTYLMRSDFYPNMPLQCSQYDNTCVPIPNSKYNLTVLDNITELMTQNPDSSKIKLERNKEITILKRDSPFENNEVLLKFIDAVFSPQKDMQLKEIMYLNEKMLKILRAKIDEKITPLKENTNLETHKKLLKMMKDRRNIDLSKSLKK
jgi:hypothetical protein